MFADICTGLISILTPETIGAVALGIFTGLMFGAIPGISGIMAISILLPMTFYVSPLVGIPMLLGIYKASMFGGSITAILLNTPGAPPAVCTAMDGYPLARQGKAGKALNAALTGSVFGDTFSNILLICVAAPLSYLTLKIGPVEQFTLILLALTVVGSISGRSLLKGMSCAGFGLLLATVGVSATTGDIRFTFGHDELVSGIALIPMVIGLLCLPEVIHQARAGIRRQVLAKIDLRGENGRLTWPEFRRNLPLLFRSSIIGSIIGALPGLGVTPAAYMAYSEAQRTSKTPEKFGKGMVEGVLAPEAANNAVTGSAMIPMLTLGVPGDGATAILMGAFMLHGMVPGPSLFAEQGNVLYAIMLGLLVVNVFMYIVGTGLTRFYAHITRIPYEILAPIVLTFCIAGSYSTNNRIYDIYIILIFGIVSYFLRRMGFQLVPILLGIVLGPLAEKNFRRAMVISEGSFSIFFTRPISCAFILIAIVSVAIFGIRNYKSRKLAKQNTAETSERK